MIARLANSQNSWRGLAPVSQPSFAPKLVALEFLTQNSRRLVFSAKKMAVSLKRASERLLCEGYKWQFMTTSDCCPLSTLKIRQHHSAPTAICNGAINDDYRHKPQHTPPHSYRHGITGWPCRQLHMSRHRKGKRSDRTSSTATTVPPR